MHAQGHFGVVQVLEGPDVRGGRLEEHDRVGGERREHEDQREAQRQGDDAARSALRLVRVPLLADRPDREHERVPDVVAEHVRVRLLVLLPQDLPLDDRGQVQEQRGYRQEGDVGQPQVRLEGQRENVRHVAQRRLAEQEEPSSGRRHGDAVVKRQPLLHAEQRARPEVDLLPVDPAQHAGVRVVPYVLPPGPLPGQLQGRVHEVRKVRDQLEVELHLRIDVSEPGNEEKVPQHLGNARIPPRATLWELLEQPRCLKSS